MMIPLRMRILINFIFIFLFETIILRENIQNGMKRDFLTENPNAKQLLEENEAKYYTELHGFVNSNHKRYYDKYVNILKNYDINVTLINWE